MEKTLEEYKVMNQWLSNERKRLFNDVQELNNTIEEQELQLKKALDVLFYCAHDALGAAYKERDARTVLIEANRKHIESALCNKVLSKSTDKDRLDKLYTRMHDIAPISENELHQFFILVEKYSTYKESKKTKNPFGELRKLKNGK